MRTEYNLKVSFNGKKNCIMCPFCRKFEEKTRWNGELLPRRFVCFAFHHGEEIPETTMPLNREQLGIIEEYPVWCPLVEEKMK